MTARQKQTLCSELQSYREILGLTDAEILRVADELFCNNFCFFKSREKEREQSGCQFTDGEETSRLFLERAAAAEEADDERDGPDDDEDDWSVPDDRVWATDVHHVQIADDRRPKLHRDARPEQCHAA